MDLNLRVREQGDGLLLSLQYSSELYGAPRIQRLLAQYEAVLRAVAAQPELRLGQLVEQLERDTGRRQEERQRDIQEAGRARLRRLRRQDAELEAVARDVVE